MTIHDQQGQAVSGANADSLADYEAAIHQFNCYIGDPVASVDRAIEASPGFVMAHALKAYLHLLGAEPLLLPVARDCWAAARDLPMTERERGHVEAIGDLATGRWRAASRTLEDVAIEHPRDLLALQAGHVVDFFLGDSRMLRDRIARALPVWSPDAPGYHTLLGMHAFGLQECWDFPQAERAGRACVELERRDGWGWHAVAHVMEMQNRREEGVAWLRRDTAAWAEDSFFSVHNWWHLALHHLDLGDVDSALALYDGPIYGARSTVVFDMIDASALLWRLHLRGVDVGDRWRALADNWAPIAGAGNSAFNDAHAMMAFVGAGRSESIAEVLEAQLRAMGRGDDNAEFTREVGHPVTRAIEAFGRGDWAETTRLLRPARNIANRCGGSNAQRDILDLTLIEAALRSDQRGLARALTNERLAAKPSSPFSRVLADQASRPAAA